MTQTSKRPRPQQDSSVQRLKEARATRHRRIASGQTPGLFMADGKRLRPEIEAMIAAALAEKARGA